MKLYKAKEAEVLTRYQNKLNKPLLLSSLMVSLLWAPPSISIPLGGGNVNIGPDGVTLGLPGGATGNSKSEWELSVEGDSSMMECTLQGDAWETIIKAPNKKAKQGICGAVERASSKDKDGNLLAIFNFINTGNLGGLLGTFLDDNTGSSFDLGGFARCDVSNLTSIKKTSLGKFCEGNELSLSPITVMGTNSVDGEGIIGGGAENSEKPKTVSERRYQSGLSGKELFIKDKNGIDGGYLIGKMHEDPYSSTATAFNTYDKATIVLKTMALKTVGNDESSAMKLPKTKGESIDFEDETVQIAVRMNHDLNEFGETLSRKVISQTTDKDNILEKAKEKGYKNAKGKPITKVKELTLMQYRTIEQLITSEYYSKKEAGLIDIYKGIEYEAKTRLASEELLMTADPNYIADPSEARLAYIKDSQKNAFRYASLIQQEKNKHKKLEIAMELQRKRRLIDITKTQAEIRASRFRDDIAKAEINRLLKKADESVTYK